VRRKSDDQQYLLGLARACQRLGSIDAQIKKYDDAFKPLAQSVAIYGALARTDPSNPKYLQSLACAHGRSFEALHFSGRSTEALRSVERAVAVYEEFTRQYPAVTSARQDMARRLSELAYYQTRLGQNEDSILSQKRAISIMEAVFKANPTVVANRNSLSWYSGQLGYDLGTAGRTAEALPYLDRSLGLIEEDVKKTPGAVPTLYVATVKVRYGVTLSRGGRAAEAREKLEQALVHYDSLLSDPKQTGITFNDFASDYTEAAVELAWIHAAQGDAAAAARLCQPIIGREGSPAAQDPELVFQLARAHSLFGQLRTHAEINPATANTLPAVHEFLTAIKLLGHAFAGGYRNLTYIRTDPALAPLRDRPDFRLLMMDLAFPVEVFDRTE
jgi:eukaryotic-like serine/threonine-protein kinase